MAHTAEAASRTFHADEMNLNFWDRLVSSIWHINVERQTSNIEDIFCYKMFNFRILAHLLHFKLLFSQRAVQGILSFSKAYRHTSARDLFMDTLIT